MFPYYKKNDKRVSLLYFVLLTAALCWNALIVSVPLLARSSEAGGRAAGWITLFFAPVCHQLSGRCFTFMDRLLPVCSRCTGIYLGFTCGILMFPLFKKNYMTASPDRRLLLGALLPLLVQVTLEKTGIWQGGLWLRFFTGLVAGAAAVFYVLPPLNSIFKK